MKKLVIFAVAVMCLGAVSATGTFSKNENPTENPIGGTVKIVNDTKESLTIHTGQAHVKLISGGGSTSVGCEAGRKISLSDGSKATKLLFKIDESMCGKTVKLSAYL